jgi:SPP1 gp7 family putative phage head morphogenesis protein
LPAQQNTRAERSAWAKVRRADTEYARRLRAIARHVAEILNGFSLEDPLFDSLVQNALVRYAELIRPWARTTGLRMLQDVERRDAKAWATMAQQMSRALRLEIANAPTGQLFRDILDEQVDLITSLPLEAAQRVHELTIEGLLAGKRAAELVPEIHGLGDITVNRATLIARTEVARTSSSLTQARAEYVGSAGYRWLTVRDARVRPSHRTMEGKFVRWDEPPTLDNMTGHAGNFPNCRCTPLPVIPDILPERRAA